METSVKSASLPEKHDHVDLSNSHCGLYQQLYVPQFNAPNPNMVELEKLYKKYPKLSKPLFILNFILLFVLLFNIAHKFNSLSWNMDHGCGANEVFLSFGVVSSLLWFGNCFLFGYSLMKKVEIGLRVSYFLLGMLAKNFRKRNKRNLRIIKWRKIFIWHQCGDGNSFNFNFYAKCDGNEEGIGQYPDFEGENFDSHGFGTE